MKTFEQFLTSKGISKEMFEEMDAEKQLALHNEHKTDLQKQYEQALSEKATTEQLEAFKNEMTSSNSSVIKIMEGLALTLKAQGERISFNEMPTSLEKQLEIAIKENADEIRNAYKNKVGTVEITLKAVETIATTNATNPDGIPELLGVQTAPPSNVNLRPSTVESLVTTIPTNQPVYAYTETLPKEGDAAFVLEKGLKPQIDLKMETRYAQPVKVAAWEHLTEESVQDIPRLQAIATDFLRKKHDLRKEKGIIDGDGIAPNPLGFLRVGRTFVPGAMANALPVVNFMDVVNAVITDIFTTHNYQDEMPYMANLVLLNPIDFFLELVSAKDANGLPLYPSASLFNRVTIGGVTIVPHHDIPQGKISVSDLSKYNITNYKSYIVKIGWINDDFIRNQFVILGESRFHAFVKELDKNAFVYDDIAVIKAALLAP